MQRTLALQLEIETTEAPASGLITKVFCLGQLAASTANTIKTTVKPLIAGGGSIILDLTGIDFIDGLGLGALVALKASAINAGHCTLQLSNLSDKILEFLKAANLTELFCS
jgi:anti-anti-sigma factor